MKFGEHLETEEGELTLLRDISVACTLLSSIFMIVILSSYFFLRKRGLNFFFELGVLVIIAYIPLILSSFVISNSEGTLCNIFGPLRVYSNISLVFWIGIFARTVQVTVKKNLEERDLTPWKLNYLLIGFVPGVLSAVVPFTGGGYALINDYCWINLSINEDFYDWFLMLGFYILPKIIGIIVVIAFVIDTLLYLRKFTICRTSPEFRLLVIYPIIFVLSNPVDLFVRVYSTALRQTVPSWLTLVYILLRQLQGFFYCLVFALSPKFRVGTRRLCKRKKTEDTPTTEGSAQQLQIQQTASLIPEERVMICHIFEIEVKRSNYQTFLA